MSVHGQSVRSALGDELRNLRWAFDSNDRRRAELLALADKVDDALNPECPQTGCFLRHGHEETYRLRDELDGLRAVITELRKGNEETKR